MRRLLCMVMTGVMVIGCMCTSAGAVGEVNATSGKHETTETAVTRATGSFDITIKAKNKATMDSSFSMAAGETVRIRASYSPENASMDFGLLDSDGVYHYINVITGSVDVTIEVPENGSYTLVIMNNSSKSVNVTGIVRY